MQQFKKMKKHFNILKSKKQKKGQHTKARKYAQKNNNSGHRLRFEYAGSSSDDMLIQSTIEFGVPIFFCLLLFPLSSTQS